MNVTNWTNQTSGKLGDWAITNGNKHVVIWYDCSQMALMEEQHFLKKKT